jgi:hypothetical protein
MNQNKMETTEEIQNRYGDKFKFTLLEDGNIQWEGNFKYCRYGYPNIYIEAYKKYLEDEPHHDHLLILSDFKKAVHGYDKETYESSELSKKYTHLIYSDIKTINMVDPSGGPYLSEGMKMLGKTIKEFKSNDKGYLIITE